MSAPENPKAFPLRARSDGSILERSHEGMDLRDWFAGQALPYACTINQQFLQAHPDANYPFHAAIAKDAYEIADAMLAARAKAVS